MSYLYNVNNQPVTGDISTATAIQTSTGAIARSLRAHFGDVIFAADYGVQANGVSDDTAAWANAFNAAVGTQKYNVVAPVGVSVISSIQIPIGATLRGATPTNSYPYTTGATTLLGSVLKKTSGTSSAVTTLQTDSGNDRRATAMVDMAIIGDAGVHHGVTLGGGIPFHFRNCVFTGCNVGIEGQTNSGGGFPVAVIQDCTFSENVVGIWNIGDSRIVNCYINGQSSHGIQLDSGAQDNIIMGNKIEFNQGNGIQVDQTEDVIIANNIIDSSTINNIRWTGNRNGVISGNALRNFTTVTMTGAHLFMQGNTDTCVTGNTTRIAVTTPTFSVNLGTGNTRVIMFGNAWKGHAGSTSITGLQTGLNDSSVLTAVTTGQVLSAAMVNSI